MPANNTKFYVVSLDHRWHSWTKQDV